MDKLGLLRRAAKAADHTDPVEPDTPPVEPASVDECIFVWSMRPQPGTPTGDAWEAGARQGWAWLKSDYDSLQSALKVAQQELKVHRDSAPLCDEHKPDGGVRGTCLVCACIKLSAALSRCDYYCDKPNEQEVSGYDVHCDQDTVVENVKALYQRAEKAEAELDEFKRDAERHLKERDLLVSEYERAVKCGKQGYVHAVMHLYNAITNAKINSAIDSEKEGK